MGDWRFERMENMVHVHEREEYRCAVEAAERAGEFDDRPSKSDFYGEDRDYELDEDFEGYDDE
jgi:hypothetical protein